MKEIAGYIKVANEIREQIIKGDFQEGDLLPSENELSRTYGLTRMTIRNALKNLENDGFIEKRQGKGSIVKSKRKSFEMLKLKGFTEVMKVQDGSSRVTTKYLNPIELRDWPDDFHWELSHKELEVRCIQMIRTRYLDKDPVMLERTFFPNLYIKDFIDTPLVNESLFDTLAVNHSIEMIGVQQKIRAIAADQVLVEALDVEFGDPVLEIIRKLNTNMNHFHVYTYAYCITKEFSLEI